MFVRMFRLSRKALGGILDLDVRILSAMEEARAQRPDGFHIKLWHCDDGKGRDWDSPQFK